MDWPDFLVTTTDVFSDRRPRHPALVCSICGLVLKSWGTFDPAEAVSLASLNDAACEHMLDHMGPP